jgi:hypothetical protein
VAGITLAASPIPFSEDLGITANYLIEMSHCSGSGGFTNFTSWTGAFTSANQAATWSGGCQPFSGTDLTPNYDPMAVYDASGNLFSGQLGDTSTAEGVFLQELPAGSTLWGNFFPILSYTNPTTVDFYDYDFPGLAIDNYNSPSCLYVTAWETGKRLSNNALVSAVAVGHSCNAGATWTTKRVSGLPASPTLALYSRVAVAQNGTVLATWVQNGGGKTNKVYESSSSDGGNTWTTPLNVFDITQAAEASCSNNYPHVDRALPHTCVRMYYFPQLASTFSTSAGQAFHAVYPNYNGTHVAVNYSFSPDGKTWSSPVVLSSVSADQFEPCISSPSQSSSMLGVAWLDTRNSPTGKPDSVYDAYGIASSDGGATWSSVYRLSAQSGSPTVETKPNSQYLGDWTGCAWQNGIFYYAFPSTANGSHQVAMIAGLNP